MGKWASVFSFLYLLSGSQTNKDVMKDKVFLEPGTPGPRPSSLFLTIPSHHFHRLQCWNERCTLLLCEQRNFLTKILTKLFLFSSVYSRWGTKSSINPVITNFRHISYWVICNPCCWHGNYNRNIPSSFAFFQRSSIHGLLLTFSSMSTGLCDAIERLNLHHFCHAGSGRVGRAWPAMENPLKYSTMARKRTRATERTDSKILSFTLLSWPTQNYVFENETGFLAKAEVYRCLYIQLYVWSGPSIHRPIYIPNGSLRCPLPDNF